MTNLSELRTTWHTCQRATTQALSELFDNWTPQQQARYEAAAEAEKTAELNYLKALAARHKNQPA